MAGLTTVGVEPSVGKMPSPDDVVSRIEREIYFDSVTFGGYTDQGRAFPVGTGTAVVFCDHEGAMGHLGVPVRDEYGIERLRFPHLRALDYYHEVGDHGTEQT